MSEEEREGDGGHGGGFGDSGLGRARRGYPSLGIYLERRRRQWRGTPAGAGLLDILVA